MPRRGIGSLLSRPAGIFVDRIGARPVAVAGLVLTVLGTIPYARAGAHTSELALALSLVVRGSGLSAVNITLMAAAYQGPRREQVPHASSTTRILQQLGGAFGTAVLAVILERQLAGAPSRAAAFDHTFWWSLGFTALAFIPAVALPRQVREPAAVGSAK